MLPYLVLSSSGQIRHGTTTMFLYNVSWAVKSFAGETDLDRLHLWGLNDRGLSCLDHSVHLHCLPIRQLHQGDGGGGAGGVSCTYTHLHTERKKKHNKNAHSFKTHTIKVLPCLSNAYKFTPKAITMTSGCPELDPNYSDPHPDTVKK